MVESTYIILGSNIGKKEETIEAAIVDIERYIGQVNKQSSFYKTSPWGFDSDSYFLNKVICINTKLTPRNMMQQLLNIEDKLGRVRDVNSKGYTSRTIDLDVLFIGDAIVKEDIITVPHPRIESRKFVLTPMHEIAPNFIHPVSNKSISELLYLCKDNGFVEKINNTHK